LGKAQTVTEKVRFQFAVACTLVYELVHIFWWWTQRFCLHCEDEEPWFSLEERKYKTGPELGQSWEYWALGSRVPNAGKLVPIDKERDPPNIFTRCDCNYVPDTVEGGESDNIAIYHDFIFPVDWINSWFLEDTW
jgi:hypothetical protein